MSSRPPEQPEKEARALFEDARGELDRVIPPDAVARMHARLAASIGNGAAAPAAPSPARRATSWRALATHAAVGFASFASGYAVRAASERPTVRVEVRERTVLVPAPAPPPRLEPRVPPAAGTSAGADSGTPTRAREREHDGDVGLAAEQWWIDRASSDLRAGRGADALRSAEEHVRRFPHGQLRGLRDVLRAEALAMVGRRDEARNLARQALRRESAPGLRARLGAVLSEEGVR